MEQELKCNQVGMLSGGKWDKMHDMSRRVYSADGLAPTVHTMGGGQQELKIIEPLAYDEQNGYIRQDGCVGTLTTDGSSPKHNNRIIEPRIAAMRGRNPDNPNDRTAGSPTEQRLEIGSDETSNTLTTVQKDNLVVEPNEKYIGCAVHPLSKKLEFDGYKDTVCPTLLATDYKCPKTVAFAVEPMIWGSLQANCAKKKDGICPTLTSAMGDGGGQIPMHNYDYRIRKLTECECFRLMGVKEEDFKRVAKNQSTSSLYHLAGDSIVTTCLMAIFGELFNVDYQSKINELVEELRQ